MFTSSSWLFDKARHWQLHWGKGRWVAGTFTKFGLKLRLVPVTASRPSGEGNRRYAKWLSLESVAQPSALPGRWHALRAAVCAPLWLSWHRGIGQALRAGWLVSGLRPVMWCVPRPPLCFAAARHQPCALVCPSAPRGGSLSPRAFAFGFCYKFRSCLRTKYGGLLLHANQSGSNRVSAFLHVGRPVPAILLHHDALFDDALYCLDAFHHAANGFIALGVTGIK